MALRLGVDLKLFDAIDAQVGPSPASAESSSCNPNQSFDVSAICEALSHADPLLIRKSRLSPHYARHRQGKPRRCKAVYVFTKYFISVLRADHTISGRHGRGN